MTRSTSLLTASAVLATLLLAGPTFAQGAKQTVTLVEITAQTLASGYRASKIVGSAVYNDADEKIGKLDDLIITSTDNAPYAIVSVGGFLGMDKHYVAVPASALEVVDKKLVLHGATKESLKNLPNYTYAY